MRRELNFNPIYLHQVDKDGYIYVYDELGNPVSLKDAGFDPVGKPRLKGKLVDRGAFSNFGEDLEKYDGNFFCRVSFLPKLSKEAGMPLYSCAEIPNGQNVNGEFRLFDCNVFYLVADDFTIILCYYATEKSKLNSFDGLIKMMIEKCTSNLHIVHESCPHFRERDEDSHFFSISDIPTIFFLKRPTLSQEILTALQKERIKGFKEVPEEKTELYREVCQDELSLVKAELKKKETAAAKLPRLSPTLKKIVDVYSIHTQKKSNTNAPTRKKTGKEK